MFCLQPQPSSPDSAIASLTGSGIRACDENQWLIGQFDLSSAPSWGPASRLTAPPTHSLAILLTNHDENRNVWSTCSVQHLYDYLSDSNWVVVSF